MLFIIQQIRCYPLLDAINGKNLNNISINNKNPKKNWFMNDNPSIYKDIILVRVLH